MAQITTRITATAGVAAVALTLAACSPSDTDGGDTDGPVTLETWISQDMETLFPGDAGSYDNISVLDVVYDGLVRYDPETTEPYNYVAESIEPDEDNTVWTITIKPDLTFQNGEPVDAEAFARSWNYTADGDNGLYSNYFFGIIEGYDEMQPTTDDEGNITAEGAADELSGLEILDPLTLQVTLDAPFAGFATMLGYTGFFPVAQECLDDVDACATQPIGNGPFRVTEWQQSQELTAEKWADYPLDETPAYDAIHWTEYATGETSGWADFKAGDLDLSFPPTAEVESARNDPELAERYVERPGAALTYLGFSGYTDGPWNDIEFRKAISMAIDREGIIASLGSGQATPADSWVVPGGVPGGEAGTCEWCVFDPEAARAALERAGGWPEGEKLQISLGDDDAEVEYFTAIGNSIEEVLGIPYELNILPSTDYFTTRAEQGFDGMFRNNWFPDYPLNENYLSFYASGEPGAGHWGWYSEEFEAKLAEAAAAPSLDESVALYQEAEAILAEEFPTIPFRWGFSSTYYSERLDNVILNPFSGAPILREIEVSDG
ncbi:peptide ABC transporter substrate-binding protein [Myceligenerans salitolerans]|uniref:ABC transporter substrate-binding protein n=1 Tax=Myceligenerans salitolerans TaxID=1230528 RepID=A0ABS3IGR9_9MICO|nr:ABC transporter substrate-binding protein [Myceligenerans salitolerans]MBO0611252.1 ABC transporter substrate-binding protein [Myceligenerans salitolerans]